MTYWRLAVAGATSGVLSLSCQSTTQAIDCHDDEDPIAIAAIREPLTGAADSPEYLGLAAEEIAALVHIRVRDALEGEATCSGTFLNHTWIISAAHCAPPTVQSVEVYRVDEKGEVLHGWIVERIERHPDLDLVLFEVVQDGPEFSPITPSRGLADNLLGQRGQMAGTGASDRAPPGSLQFAVTRIVELTDEELIVDAEGYAGACVGDSGGPLLLRGPRGLPEIAGVLSHGNVSCFSTDAYVRVDVVRDWIRDIAGEPEAVPALCGEIDKEGACFGAVAAYCARGELRAAVCSRTEHCGYSTEELGFRCVRASLDPCDGVGEIGTCRDGDALTCSAGRLLRNVCSKCGASCVISPRSGKAQCVLE